MKTCILGWVSLFCVAVGCKTAMPAPSSSPVGGAGACATGNATGEWSGTGKGAAGNFAITATIWQDGSRVTIAARWNNTEQNTFWNHTFEGSIRCDSRTFMVHAVNENPRWEVSGSLSADFATLTGSWTADGGGEFTASKI